MLLSKNPSIKSSFFIQVNKNEAQNWLQDYTMIGFDKSFYNTDNIISKFREESDLSNELTVWKLSTPEHEDVLLFSKKSNNVIHDNEHSFKHFVQSNYENPKYKNKFVAFVDGCFEGVSENESELVEEIYHSFGNVQMFVGKVTLDEQEDIVDTPDELE